MTIPTPLITGLDHECRSLCSQHSESLPTRFFVGTNSVKYATNQVHLLEYDDAEHSISKLAFRHSKGQIWNMVAHSKNCQTLITNFEGEPVSPRLENHVGVWHIPVDISESLSTFDHNSPITDLELKCLLDTKTLNLEEEVGRQVRLRPDEEDQIMLMLETKLARIDMESQKVISLVNCDGLFKNNKSSLRSSKLQNFAWNPHFNGNVIAYIIGSNICSKDLRENVEHSTWNITNAHQQAVRDVDFNPNSQYYLATCGDDCDAKFWDLRNTSAPVVTFREHTHWLWSIQYNSFHDNLVLTGSSDGNVNLLRVSSISSMSFNTSDVTDNSGDSGKSMASGSIEGMIDGSGNENNLSQNGLIHQYREHEDSVYGCRWSASDAWTFGSISYDGRFILNKVPGDEKQAILNFSLSQLEQSIE